MFVFSIRSQIPAEMEAIVLLLPEGDLGGKVKVHVTNALQREAHTDVTFWFEYFQNVCFQKFVTISFI